MSERAREPLIFEGAEEEPEPQPATGSAGAIKPPGRIGSDLWDDRGILNTGGWRQSRI